MSVVIHPDPLDTVGQPRRRVFDEITEHLKAEIASGRLRSGDKLRPERELAAQLHVSRNSLREALKALEMLDVVDIRHGQGVYVRLPQPSVLSKTFGTLVSMQRGDADDVMEARIALDCQAARLACRYADEIDFQRMQRAIEQLADVSGSAIKGAEADHEFHSAIIDSTRNSIVIFLYRAVDVLLRESHSGRWRQLLTLPYEVGRLHMAHLAILDGIRSRQEDRAARAMEAHFKLIREIFPG